MKLEKVIDVIFEHFPDKIMVYLRDKLLFNDNIQMLKYNRYIEDLKSIMVDVEMSDKEFEKYRYKPKLLCVELYDNIDLAPLILRMNNMLSVLEFNKKNIKLFKTSVISYLNEMKNLEKSRLDENESENNKIING